ncbi:hypothetical protein JCM8097_002957 [Rhodosporidiobolus ruineniae]
MDTPTGHLSPQHPSQSHTLVAEPEELPALSNLDLNSLTELDPNDPFNRQLHQLHQQSHHAHPHSHSPYPGYTSRPLTPSRQYPPQALPLSPSSPVTDPEDDGHTHDLLHSHGLHSAEASYIDSYFPPSSDALDDFYAHPRNPGDLPPEIIALIIHHLYYGYLPYPAAFPSPDPYLELLPPNPHLFFPEPARLAAPLDMQAKETLAACALVDKLWNAEATRALWRRVSFGMPRAFESVLRTIEEYSGGRRTRRPLRSDLRSRSGDGEGPGSLGASLGLEMTPKAEGPPGKEWRQQKGEYVERWRREGSEGFAVGEVLETPVDIEASSQHLGSAFAPPVPTVSPLPLPRLNPRDSPLLFTRSISFARFRTAGMKRSIRSGKEERFVTSERLVTLLRGTRYPKRKLQFPVEKEDEEGGAYGGAGFKGYGAYGAESETETETETDTESEAPDGPAFGGWGRNSRKKVAGQLCQVGFSEYMDSAISLPVLEELLFRGGYLAEYEEPEEPAFFQDFASSSESEAGGSTPYLSNNLALTPGADQQPFHYRHLQSSHSRSPDEGGRRRRSSSVSTSIAEEEENGVAAAAAERARLSQSPTPGPEFAMPAAEGELTPEQEHPDSFGPRDPVAEDAEMGDGARTPIGRSGTLRQRHRRRLSGLELAAHNSAPAVPMVQAHEVEQPLQQQSHAEGEYYSSGDSDLGSMADDDERGERGEDEERRGRERFGRNRFGVGGGSGGASGLTTPSADPFLRGRSRFPISRPSSRMPGGGGNGFPAPPNLVRSSSLPAPFHPTLHNLSHSQSPAPNRALGLTQQQQQQQQPYRPLHHQSSGLGLNVPAHAHIHASSPLRSTASRGRTRAPSISRASERSSSVPASVSGRLWAEPVPKRTVQVLEGSLGMQPVRALDLCGCVSRVFVAALEELVGAYKLGPPEVKGPQDAQGGADDEDEDEDDPFAAGRRTPSIRSVRMGLAEERVLNRTFFPHLRRLGLASSLLPSHLLTSFVLSFPYLTHLDLASTLTSPMLLKGLALAGQNGIGGRPMRLKALSLARCRLITGPALLGLFCGDCPPMTTMAGLSDDDNESWGAGEVVSELTDLSLFGDGTYPCPLEGPELRLVLTVSPAFRSGLLRTVDLSSTPMTDEFLTEQFPPQPNLVELGLAHCRAISMQAVATFLTTRANGVEVLDLSHSCPSTVGQGISSRRRTTIGQPTISVMELHAVLLAQCASLESSSSNPEEAQLLLALRQTNLRVVELDEKSLEMVQGGAGDWKPIPGKGRRGWYVDTATTSRLPPYDPYHPPFPRPRQLTHLHKDDPQRQALLKLVSTHSAVTFEIGWHSRKMEILRGDGLMGVGEGLYAYHSLA